ncbi:hypothetical protein ACS0TY_000900 [Phlomoides rotata]
MNHLENFEGTVYENPDLGKSFDEAASSRRRSGRGATASGTIEKDAQSPPSTVPPPSSKDPLNRPSPLIFIARATATRSSAAVANSYPTPPPFEIPWGHDESINQRIHRPYLLPVFSGLGF